MTRKKIVFDVGACKGESIERFNDYDEIYCFEPCSFSFIRLKENFESDPRIKFFNVAISNKNGLSEFYYYYHYAYSSLNQLDIEGEFSKFCEEFDPGFDKLEYIETVETLRLDYFINQNKIDFIDYLKIDTQGSDLDVIKSLGRMISIVDTIELEVQLKTLYKNSSSKKDILSYMEENNFILVSDESNGLGLEDFERKLIFKNKSLSIPVIGTAVVNSSYWVKRLLKSIDYPVENFFIVNNNGKGELDDELEELKKENNPYVKNIKICNLPGNIGCSGAWNLIIKCFIMSPYWIIVNDDVAFDKGFLQEMVSTSRENSDTGVIHGLSGDFDIGSWDLFLIKDFVIKKLGLFDENCYPAYCEDVDYLMRLLNSNTKRITSLNSNYFHGDGNKEEYYTHASQTSKKDPELSVLLRHFHDLNMEYLNDKWGPDWRGCSPNKLPFLDKERTLSETTYDLEFLRKKYTGF
jgi:FkbM family methyltransferase